MAARFCVECGNLVTTAFCPSCGAIQPGSQAYEWQSADPDGPTGPDRAVADPRPTDAATSTPTGALGPQPADGDSGPGQPWHPFEQPSWYSGSADPRADDPTVRVATGPRDPQGDFMGVSSWQTDAPPPDRRHTWILGALAAAAVVAVLVAVAFFVIRGSATDSATPDSGRAPVTVATTQAGQTPTGSTGQPGTAAGTAPPVTVTVTGTESSGVASTASAASSAAAAPNPMGGPDRDIACSPGYVVQVASAASEADFVARVAELRAAGQLPADILVARTATSCPIFASQRNSLVLYVGPFSGQYDGCSVRLAGAADSFIKGTTEQTAKQYISCLCPQSVTTIPTITAVGQTGVWVGELQRVLANKLNYKIPDLGPTTWGVYTQTTSDAVTKFQTDQSLPPTGQVDAGTWLNLQAAQC